MLQTAGGAIGLGGQAAGRLFRNADALDEAVEAAADSGRAADELVEGADDFIVSDVYDPNTNQLRVLQEQCFAPETLVATPDGPREIKDIREGDTVLAFNHEAGEWAERRVEKFHENIYEGPLVTLHTEAGEVRTTIYHPFWVEAGWDLEERPTPRELAENEDEGYSLRGRWVNSHDLRVGDILVSRDGSRQAVLKIEQEFVQAFLVHNLTIEGDHTFAVGADALLVHNTGGCDVGTTRHIELEKADNGSYTVEFESGLGYAGKGGTNRARRSARQHSRLHNDPVKAIDHTPAQSNFEAYKQEAIRLDKLGGPASPLNYNKINSPGKYL